MKTPYFRSKKMKSFAWGALSSLLILPGISSREALQQRAPAADPSCQWDTTDLSDPDAPEGQIQVPALVCKDAARNELTRFEPAEFPWEKFPRPHDCAFRPAEILTSRVDSNGNLATRVIEPETPTAILHLKEDLKRLSRGETPVCLAPEKASIIRSVLNPPAPSPSPLPAPSPAPQAPPRAALRGLDEQFKSRLQALEQNAAQGKDSGICVVIDHSESMTPHVRAVISRFQHTRPPAPVAWAWVDASAPLTRRLHVVRSNYPGVLTELGTDRNGSSAERLTESVARCRDELIFSHAAAREIWVISDETDLPAGSHEQPESLRRQLERDPIALHFLDPLHEFCPTLARAGLKDSTRAHWIHEGAARHRRFAERCSTEIARAASLGYLGNSSWRETLPLIEGLDLEARAITLISALRAPESGLTAARAQAVAGRLKQQFEQMSEQSEAMDLVGLEQQETLNYHRHLMSELHAALSGK